MSTNQVEQIFEQISSKLDKEEKLYLVQKIITSLLPSEDQTNANNQMTQTKRILGLHLGSVWMSDDFDEPLPDEFWLGESPLL